MSEGDVGEDDPSILEAVHESLWRLRTLRFDEVLYIGDLPSLSLTNWPNRITDRVVITAERRRHYLERHPDVEPCEDVPIEAVRDPDEIHRYVRDITIANVYRQIDEQHDIVASIQITHAVGMMNSVMTARISRKRDRDSARRRGLLLWNKQK